MKRLLLVIVLALLAASCGDGGMLDGLGDRSARIVHGETTLPPSSQAPSDDTTPLGSVRSSDVIWFNDGLAGEGIGEIGQIIAAVWARGDGVTSVIQATRNEIAVALPGVQFPELLPDEVSWVTSQLVYDVASATLDADTAAQFGLWYLEPYSSDGGRTALMWVRPATGADTIGSITPENTTNGLSLTWVAESFHYRVLCPTTLQEEYCWQLAESAMPLSLLLPEPAAESGDEAGTDA